MSAVFGACWRLVERYLQAGVKVADSCHVEDALLWHKGLTKSAMGEYSIAVVQANASLEDQSQIKAGPFGTLIGIYDGHGGSEAARFITRRLFPNIEKLAREAGGMSGKVLKQALCDTEDEFLGLIEKTWRSRPQILSVGSCCLVGVVTDTHLYVANLGDSKVVLGRAAHMPAQSSSSSSETAHIAANQSSSKNVAAIYSSKSGSRRQDNIVAVRLSAVHNAANSDVREELRAQHPDDSQIVMVKHGVWRVKGIIQISRSIGDVYLKKPEYHKNPVFSHSPTIANLCIKKPVLSADPSLTETALSPHDRFLIFASDGLWDFISDQDAVKIVNKEPRKGIAKRLVKVAMQRAAEKFEMHYSDLKRIEPGARRYIHDDISVIVVYLDYNGVDTPKSSPKRKPTTHSTVVNAPRDIFSSDNSEAYLPLI